MSLYQETAAKFSEAGVEVDPNKGFSLSVLSMATACQGDMAAVKEALGKKRPVRTA